MSSLLEKVQEAQLSARKAADAQTLSIAQVVLSALKNEQIKLGGEITDEQAQRVINTQAKQLKDALKDFESGGRVDLIEKTKAELAFIQQFLPEQLSEEQIESVVKEVIAESGATGPSDMGRVMGAVMGKLKGQADGNVVRELVQKCLSN